jgi:aspartate/methionine/tyrosine aminotransferase
MQVADRLLQTPPYPFAELARLKAKAVAEGADLIDLGIGDPDLPTPDHVVEAVRQAAGDPTDPEPVLSGLSYRDQFRRRRVLRDGPA